MNTRSLCLLSLCVVLAACNSESAGDSAPTNDVMAPAGTGADAMNAGMPIAMEPAPEGLPSRIAQEVISASGQTCDEVTDAERAADGTINAVCSGGEIYQVYVNPGQGPMATPR